MTTVRVTEDTTAADLIETLSHLNANARRQMYVVEKFTTDDPTPWSAAHRRMDGAIDDVLDALAGERG